jgi:membrane-bound ClpP family serine protease
MSETGSFWINLAEKFFGLLLLILGAILIYFTATSVELGAYIGLFGFLGVIVIVAGAFLIIVKPPE